MYKYETHLHTAETSKCSRAGGAEMARFFAAQGYTGIFITDHFFNGNTTVPNDLPWAERVALFCSGYDAAKAEGDRVGLDVFFAWEYHHGWTHFLTYGLDAAWLSAHSDVTEWPLDEYVRRVRADGGFVVHAHPFRVTPEPMMRILSEAPDGVEILNAGRSDAENLPAADYARCFGIPITAGSDIHRTTAPRRSGVLTETRIRDAADYLSLMKAGQLTLFTETPEQQV